LVPIYGNERFDSLRFAGLDISGTVISRIRQQARDFPPRLRQGRDPVQHRPHLFFVVARLGQARRNDQQRACIDCGLGVVGWLEAAPRLRA
jgi:hypothetical protein